MGEGFGDGADVERHPLGVRHAPGRGGIVAGGEDRAKRGDAAVGGPEMSVAGEVASRHGKRRESDGGIHAIPRRIEMIIDATLLGNVTR